MLVNSLQEKFEIATTDDGDLQPLWNTLFWISIIFACVLVLHVLLRALVVWRRMKMPTILAWPRLELTALTCFLPIIVAGAAGYLASEDSTERTVGIVFAVVLPGLFLGLSTYLVVKHLALVLPERRTAYYLINPNSASDDSDSEDEDEEDMVSQEGSDASGGPVLERPSVAGSTGSSEGLSKKLLDENVGDNNTKKRMLKRSENIVSLYCALII